jgi:ABC-type lipoprotein release transport system permease subunit
MRAGAMVLHAQLRQRWKSWLALAGLVALVGGFVLAAAATGRRTADAFPGFVARHGYDAEIYSLGPVKGLARIPEVAQVTTATGPYVVPGRCASCRKPLDFGNFDVLEVPPTSLPRMVQLLSGRMPDQSRPDEVLASYTFQQDFGVRLGSVIQVLVPTPAQLKQGSSQGGPTPAQLAKLARRSVRVVGFVVTEPEFHYGIGARYDLFATQAFAAAVNPHTKTAPVYFVRLRHGAADLPAFDSQLRPLGSLGADELDADAAAIQRSIKPQAVGWWVLAGLAALAGLAVIGQAAARQFAPDQDDQLALSAMGLRVGQFVALGLARAAVIGAAGAAGAVGLAALLSPLTPVGEARLAAPSAGAVVLDPQLTVAVALGTVLAVVALSAWPAVRHARLLRGGPAAPAEPVALIRVMSRVSVPPTALIGVRHALVRGRGRHPVPVGTALLGTVVAVAALCATAVFGASLTKLVSTPALYGVPFQAELENPGGASEAAAMKPLLASLRQAPAIAQITLATTANITINGHQVRAVAMNAVRGPALLSVVDGKLPAGDHEISLGAATLRSIGAQTGDLVQVAVPDHHGTVHRAQFRVAGRAAFASSFGSGGLGNGAAITFRALTDLQCPPGAGQHSCQQQVQLEVIDNVLVRSVPGPAGTAALAQLARKYPQYENFSEEPTELVNFGESVNFPLLFGGLLALFGAATMVHLLLVSVARRRTEAGLLKVLGFLRRQVIAVVGWQATTVALVGIVVGVPLGIAAGRFAWREFATNLGVVPESVVQVAVLGVIALGVLAATNILAALPAWLAGRSRAAELMRAE